MNRVHIKKIKATQKEQIDVAENVVQIKIDQIEIVELGRTRAGGGPQFTVDLKRKLYEFFAPYNNDLFQWIGEDFEWS